jgi:OTU domain-containing protein 7
MWGIHDRLLTLRQSLHYILTDSAMAASLRRRWTYDIEQRNKEAGGLVYSQDEWDKEWEEVLHLSSCQERQKDSSQPHYLSLEEIHVFALAHVLHRPIIVISDKYLRDFDNVPIAPIYFGGVYLPLEHHPKKCSKTPLLLTYEASHFSALVSIEAQPKENVTTGKKGLFSKKATKIGPLDIIPLQRVDGSLLPVCFSIDQENLKDLASIKKTYSTVKGLSELRDDDFRKYQLKILRKYMDVTEFEVAFAQEDPQISDNPANPTGNGSIPAQPSQQSTGRKRTSFFSAFAAGFRFSNSKLKLPPDTRALGARLDIKKRPPHYEDLIAKYMESAQERFVEAQEKKQKDRQKSTLRKDLAEQNGALGAISCQTPGCEMYGTVQTDYLCSHCYANKQHHLKERRRYTSGIEMRAHRHQDTSGLGGHYSTSQNLPREEVSASAHSASRVRSASLTTQTSPCDLRLFSGYYPDFVERQSSHRLSLSYPHTMPQGGFTDAGRQCAEEYERSKRKSEATRGSEVT